MVPLTALRLLLPALVPSWRFFDTVTVSPRLDYALLSADGHMVAPWREFRPRPAALTPGAMLGRLLWNPQWNENLFLVSLAERLIHATTPDNVEHSQRELLMRVARHLDRHGACERDTCLQIRLRLVGWAELTQSLQDEVVYVSGPCPIAGLVAP